MAEQTIYNGQYSVQELEQSINVFIQFRKQYNSDVSKGYTGTFNDWLKNVGNKTLTFSETEWETISGSTTKMAALLAQYAGWVVNVVEDEGYVPDSGGESGGGAVVTGGIISVTGRVVGGVLSLTGRVTSGVLSITASTSGSSPTEITGAVPSLTGRVVGGVFSLSGTHRVISNVLYI